jgi:hypothetical protein
MRYLPLFLCMSLYGQVTVAGPSGIAGPTLSGISNNPAYYNSWVGGNNQCTTATCNLTIAPKAGHSLIVAGIYRSDLGSITSLKDSAGNSLTSLVSVTNINTHFGQFIYYETGIASGITSLQLITSAAADAEFVAYDVANQTGTSDGASSNTSPIVGGVVSGPTITPGAGDNIVLITTGYVSAATTYTVGAGWSYGITSGTSTVDVATVFAELQFVTSASGSPAAAFTYTPTAIKCNANIGALKK